MGRRKKPTKEDLELAGARADVEHQLERAREIPWVFAERVIRSEIDRRPIKVADFQRRWYQALASAEPRVLIQAPAAHGKSQTIGAFCSWLLGRFPNSRILYVGPSETRATRFVQSVRAYVESDAVRAVFPELGRGATWAASGFTLEGQGGRFEALRAVGPNTRILSTRATHIFVDDLTNRDNSETKESREKLWAWFQGELLTRAESGATKIVVSGVSYNAQDLPSTLRKTGGWLVLRDPVYRENGEPLWPEGGWTRDVIEKRRHEMGSALFNRIMMLDADTSHRHYRMSDIRLALAKGRGMASGANFRGPDKAIFGVDLAFGGKDRSAIVGIAMSEHEGNPVKRLMYAEEGNWTERELAEKCVDLWHTYKPAGFYVETNGAQKMLLTIIRGIDDRVKVGSHVTTARNKWDQESGLLGISAQLERGEWALPSYAETKTLPDGTVVHVGGEPTPESQLVIRDMQDFTVAGHTGDALMAMAIASMAIDKVRGLGWTYVPMHH